ncbi:hypothetical protein B484DRAFT_15390, partial [Ochromonadaceae sp. CCMP2298]
PTNAPTYHPTRAPTVAPTSSIPSAGPTRTPTKAPVTSSPTLSGETNPPSFNPTSVPSLDLNYETHRTYIEYIDVLPHYQNISDSYTLGNYYFKGLTVAGDCEDMADFVSNELTLPFEDLAFSKMEAYFAYYNWETQVYSNLTTQCADSVVVNGLVDALKAGSSFTGSCEGHSWRTFLCGGENIFCVDCDADCKETESCPGYAFVMNPCADCGTHSAAATILNVQTEKLILYPQVQAPLDVTPSRSSLDVAVNVTKAGNVYCAALSVGGSVASVLAISEADASAAAIATEEGLVTVTITGLSPDTTFDVYCYTDDFSSYAMTLEAALLTKVSASTQCCREILSVAAPPSIIQYVTGSAAAESVFQFGLDSLPTAALTVSISIQRYTSCSSSTLQSTSAVVTPVSYSFSAASTALTGGFTVRGSTTGCYVITVDAAGADSYTSLSMPFTMRNAGSNPTTP